MEITSRLTRVFSQPMLLAAVMAGATLLSSTRQAQAIPIFSRKYGTSCITCHAGFPKLNSVGEAFRLNGYQFPVDDEGRIKEPPVLLGTEAQKEMWPNALWPSDIPHLPPISLRARAALATFLDRPADTPNPDFQFPREVNFLSAATFGKDIAVWAEVNFEPEEDETAVEIERVFVNFTNLFAWSSEPDADGMRTASRWAALPRHALNLRIGQFEPQAIAPWASNHRRLGITPRLPNITTIGGNEFQFEEALRGIELYGSLRQYTSYAVGVVNGNGIERAFDNNDEKDFYFRLAHKWWGYPLDGEIVPGTETQEKPKAEVEVGRMRLRPPDRHQEMTTRGQSPDADGDPYQAPVIQDFWRETQFETGVFGYFGENQAELLSEEDMVADEDTIADNFWRIGFDARWQSGDLDLFAVALWGWDDDPGDMNHEGLFTWFVEGNYYFKPWMIGLVRYEELNLQQQLQQDEIRRLVPGIAFYVRTNLRVVTEARIDTSGNDTTDDAFDILLDYAY